MIDADIKIGSLSKNYLIVSLKSLIKLWAFIINIGITNQTSAFDKKRARLVNIISAWAVLIYFVYVAVFAGINPAKFVFYECLAGLLAAVAPLIMNYYREHDLACHFFILFNLVFYLFESVAAGGRDGVEYIFMPLCVVSMLFFKNRKAIFLYFAIAFLFFVLAKMSHSLTDPVFVWQGQKSLLPINWGSMFILSFLIVYYLKSENDRQDLLLEIKTFSLSNEKQKSDDLLTNILPYQTARELKQTGAAKARSFNMATVMFTDFINFDASIAALHPEKLVNEIHQYFSVFDQIISKYNIEKIKTIGDSYMCAGGLPEQNTTNPLDVVIAALEIQEFMLQKKKKKESANELFFECRIGIHTGPVTAGIVGAKKFTYDIWGDTVTVASQLQSCGQVGRVNISGSTYQLIKDHFLCSYRGVFTAKNKKEVDVYFVDAMVPHG